MTSVLIRSSAAMDKLGIAGAHCPGRMHDMMFMFKGINTGGYRHDFADTGPVPADIRERALSISLPAPRLVLQQAIGLATLLLLARARRRDA